MRIEDIKPRLKAVRASVAELAEFMGIDYFKADRLVNGRRKHIRASEVEQLNRFFELREKPVYGVADDTSHSGSGVANAQARAEIPLFGGADTPAGWRISLALASQVGRVMPHPRQASAKRAFAVEVVDELMSPRFEMTEVAYVYGGQMPGRGQDCLVEFPDLTARILQFVERNEKRYTFKQLNPARPVHIDVADNIRVHAIVGRG